MSVVCSISSCVGNGQCPARIKLYATLRRFFKFAEFRPGQLEAALAVLHRKDVFVHMATGSGKSLCIFLPPLATNDDSMGLVITPLNALMDQQVCLLCKNIVLFVVSMINLDQHTSNCWHFSCEVRRKFQ